MSIYPEHVTDNLFKVPIESTEGDNNQILISCL